MVLSAASNRACFVFLEAEPRIKKHAREILTSIPLSASTSYGTRNLTANSTIRHVVPFSRTAKIALSGLSDSPDRFSPSCSASTTDSASAPEDDRKTHPMETGAPCLPADKWLAHTHAHKRLQNMQNQHNTGGPMRG